MSVIYRQALVGVDRLEASRRRPQFQPECLMNKGFVRRIRRSPTRRDVRMVGLAGKIAMLTAV